jgi:hypothetical protein
MTMEDDAMGLKGWTFRFKSCILIMQERYSLSHALGVIYSLGE